MKPFGIAGIQMTLNHGNNLDAIEHKINTVVSIYPWVEMVVLSELAQFGPLHAYAQERPTESEGRLRRIAERHGIWLITGSAFEKVGDKVYNTAAVINPAGEVVEYFSKLFPFRPYEQGIEAGDRFVVFDVPDAGRFGVCICYDMWFPEVPRTLTAMGAEVIIHPVLTGTNDRDIELHMARANGAIFQSYIIDINGLGVGGVGQSCIIGPDGRVVHQAGTGEEFLVAELDFDSLRRERETGVRNLGQPLKSFRDSNTDFVVYHKRKWRNEYLNSLGPLATPARTDKDKMAPVPSETGPAKSVKATKKRWL